MMRYWKMSIILLVIILSIGAFYIQSSFAANKDDKLTFEFNKVSGNQKEIDRILIDGHLESNNLFQFVEITSEKTVNKDDQSFIQRIKSIPYPTIFEKLIEDHRSFMRSKERLPENFYEDKEFLAYANVEGRGLYDPESRDFNFDIEVLNKKTGDVTAIELAVPDKHKYQWFNVVEVQVVKGELALFAVSTSTDDDTDFHVYTFDLEKQKLVSDELVMAAEGKEHSVSSIYLLNDTYSSIQPEKYLLLGRDDMHDTPEGTVSELAKDDIFIYNIETKKTKKLEVPDELTESIGSSIIYQSTIFMMRESKSGLEVHRYDIEKEQWGEKLEFALPRAEDEWNPSFNKIMNGKIYVISATANEHFIHVGDVKTGKTLYKGQMKMKNALKDNKKDYQLFIDGLEIVK